jgi:ribosomal protein L15E
MRDIGNSLSCAREKEKAGCEKWRRNPRYVAELTSGYVQERGSERQTKDYAQDHKHPALKADAGHSWIEPHLNGG